MRIGVLGNCQGTLIARWLRVMLPDDEIVPHHIAMMPENYGPAAEDLRRCDAIISQFVGYNMGPIATEALRGAGPRFVLVPNLTFTGFQPDMAYLSHCDGANAGSPVGVYHSRIIVAGFLLGLDAGRIRSLFNSYVYHILGYFDEFAKAEAYFDHAAAACGFAVRTRGLMAAGPFMHSINHANVDTGKAITREAALLAGASPKDEVATIEDEMALDTVWPFYPELAARVGLAGAGTDFLRHANFSAHLVRKIDLGTMIEESLSAYTAMSDTLDFKPFAPPAAVLRQTLKASYA